MQYGTYRVLTFIDQGLVVVSEVDSVGCLRSQAADLMATTIKGLDLLGAGFADSRQSVIRREVSSTSEQVIHVLVLLGLYLLASKFAFPSVLYLSD